MDWRLDIHNRRWFRTFAVIFIAVTFTASLGAQALTEAVRAGDEARVQRLLKEGADVHAVDAQHRTALHEAAVAGRPDLIAMLMAAGADPRALDEKSREPIAFAREYADPMVRAAMVVLLSEGSQLRRPKESDPWTLHYAAARGTLSVGQMLLKLGADPNAVGSNGNRPLNVACLKGDAEFVRLLLANGVKVNARGDDGVTALHDAALGGNAEIAGLLLGAGAEIDARDKELNATPLYYAVSLGKAEFAKVLIARGASVSVTTNKGKTILQAATDSKLTELMDLLRR